MQASRIPALAHLIWFGEHLPWANVLAARSAALRGGFGRVVLHHEPELARSPAWPLLRRIRRLELRPMDPERVLSACPDGAALVRLYRALDAPAARANVVRAAVLYREGGVYLDTDTITLESFDALRHEAGAFCGLEHIVFPGTVRRSGDPRVRVAAAFRSLARAALRETPGGWRAFRSIEGLYPRVPNNAVLASAPGHPFVAELLAGMLRVPRDRRLVRYALGTHLLQETVARWQGGDLRLHEPAVFYPLGPEISAHWFRTGSGAPLGDVLRPETRLVHWYASVRTRDAVGRVDAAWVARNAHRQLFSALALPLLDATERERAGLTGSAQDGRALLGVTALGSQPGLHLRP